MLCHPHLKLVQSIVQVEIAMWLILLLIQALPSTPKLVQSIVQVEIAMWLILRILHALPSTPKVSTKYSAGRDSHVADTAAHTGSTIHT
jgi:hypothetical protein